MCKKCYLEILPQNGVAFEKKSNIYNLSGEYGVGYASNTGNEFYFDLEDYDLIKDYCWCETPRGYMVCCLNTKNKNTFIRMHQLICEKGCDHINRNGMDNRRCNLRPCTQAENTRNRSISLNNTSGIIGVSFAKNQNKWCAYITFNKNHYSLGYFIDKNDAIIARLKAEKEYFGEFAPQKDLFIEYKI